MSKLQEIFNKRKKQKEIEDGNLKVLISDVAKKTTDEMLKELKPTLIKETKDIINKTIKDLATIKKGDKGNKGEDGIGKDGADGRDYILTAKDKKEISKMIKVPVIKEVIEKPIITNEIKEEAKYEEPKEIAKKINTLESVIEMKSIKGLDAFLRKMQVSLRETARSGIKMGGGMGNWVHEVFNTTSATTSVSVAGNIAANGNAIIVRYQGQILAHNVHYTVSGKTITFTFSLENSTNIEITYVRS